MRLLRQNIEFKTISATKISIFFRLIFLFVFIGVSAINASESTLHFVKGSDTLVVYTNVTGLAPSEFYTIKVRSAATNSNFTVSSNFGNISNGNAGK